MRLTVQCEKDRNREDQDATQKLTLASVNVCDNDGVKARIIDVHEARVNATQKRKRRVHDVDHGARQHWDVWRSPLGSS